MSDNCLFFDIYSKRIGFFFNNREKIGTYFGFFLTMIYIIISIVFFVNNLISIIKRVNVRAYNLILYPKECPSIDINPNLLYFSFGLEDPVTGSRFIDESIYYPKIYLEEKIKENGEFKTLEKEMIGYEICNEKKFGDNYRHFFTEGELNNSYCFKDYNATLHGGYKYDKMSYLSIKLYPCKNSTDNNNSDIVCKSQDIIDSYLKEGYFSILAKDIGYDPSNYSFPVIPILHNSYTTIDKSFYRDFIIYYGITEIKTDTGLFLIKEKTERYLQFRSVDKSLYFRDEEEYHNGSEIINVSIRLDEIIHVLKRSYTKMPEVFSIIGGYMQIINTIFHLLVLLVNGLIPELRILNSIFHFNLKEKKMTLRIHSIRQLYSQKIRKSIFFPSDNLLVDLNNTKDNKINQSLNKSSNYLKLDNSHFNKNESNNVSRNSLMDQNEVHSSCQANNINVKKQNSFLNLNLKENEKNAYSNKKSSVYRQKNNKKFSNIHVSVSNNYKYSMNDLCPKLIDLNRKNYEKMINDYTDSIRFNTFDYYCCKKCSRRYKDIELFKLGLSLYKKRMDIKNVFTLLLYTEKKTLR